MKTAKPEAKPIKMSFKDLMSFDFENMLTKISHTPTSDNKSACAIHRVVKAMKLQRNIIVERYKSEISDKFAPKDESGKIVTQPHGGWSPAEDQKEAYDKASDEFEKQEFEVALVPLTPSILSDVKLSARDIELMGPLFTEIEAVQGPPIPMHAVQN